MCILLYLICMLLSATNTHFMWHFMWELTLSWFRSKLSEIKFSWSKILIKILILTSLNNFCCHLFKHSIVAQSTSSHYPILVFIHSIMSRRWPCLSLCHYICNNDSFLLILKSHHNNVIRASRRLNSLATPWVIQRLRSKQVDNNDIIVAMWKVFTWHDIIMVCCPIYY